MLKYIVLATAIGLCGCGQPNDASAPKGMDREVRALSIPFDNSTGFLDGYSLRIPRSGGFLWNGAPISGAVLKDYLRQYAALPHSAGRLFVAFEPGIAQTRTEWVRQQIVGSGLCQQHRCAEVGWIVKRPVVN